MKCMILLFVLFALAAAAKESVKDKRDILITRADPYPYAYAYAPAPAVAYPARAYAPAVAYPYSSYAYPYSSYNRVIYY